MKILEGKIIKFYRELQQLRQKDLVEGVCSTTHISKIERGQTEASGETVELISERLGIDMHEQLKIYAQIELLLKEWYDSIILNFTVKAEQIKKELEAIPLLYLEEFYRSYMLILTRYYLLAREGDFARSLILKMDKWTNVSPYEMNMLLHIKGIYCLHFEHDYYKAITLLKEIDVKVYHNPEYNYDLAVAYHSIKARVSSYYYANKALQFFKDARCFSRLIDTEMLMLIQLEQDNFHDPKDDEYKRLIEVVDNYGLNKQRSLLLHNYGYHQLRRGYYDEAVILYKKAINTKEPNTTGYLGSLEGYLNALTAQKSTSQQELIAMALRGHTIAGQIKDTVHVHLFQLHMYKLQENKQRYLQYLEKKAYPYFLDSGHEFLTEHYSMKLFHYYMEREDMQKANQYAKYFMTKTFTDDDFV